MPAIHVPSQEIRFQDSSTMASKEEMIRTKFKRDVGTEWEIGVGITQIPRHIAVIKDGARRYSKIYGCIQGKL